ncbi:MAG: insulinase family protein [Puniceicoccales bacterium]|jgi:zinc protease|nr:insulinase family protein [Puniceicoccales bacterium]
MRIFRYGGRALTVVCLFWGINSACVFGNPVEENFTAFPEKPSVEETSLEPTDVLPKSSVAPIEADLNAVALESYLRNDPKVIAGCLPNGFRYVLYRHPYPKDRVYALLRVQAGALMEIPVAGGIAHFLEHLAFCGSKHFPKGKMIQYLQKLGIAFGPDVNACTSFEHTDYILNLPNADDGLFSTALDIFHDYATALEIAPEEVEREKGVILSEVRDRNGPMLRVACQAVKHVFAGTLFADAISVGEPEVIKKATTEQLRNFYEKWYTPDRMILVIVGDFSPEKWQPIIESRMSSIVAKAKIPNPYEEEHPSLERKIFRYLKDEQLDKTAVSIASLSPALPKEDSIARRRKEFGRWIGREILNERLQDRNRAEDNFFLSSLVEQCEIFPRCYYSNVYLDGLKDWKQALACLEQELRKIQRFGFLPEEVDRVRKKLLSISEHAYRSFETLPSSGIASAIVESLHRGLYLLSPKDSYELNRRLLESMEPPEVAQEWNELWSYPNRFVFMSGPQDLGKTIHSEVEKAHEDSAQMPVVAPQTKHSEAFAYTKPSSETFSTLSCVESHHYVKDLDFHQIIFKNHVRLNVKITDFKKNHLKVAIHFGKGLLEANPGEKGLFALMASMFINGGLGKHSIEDLEKILSDRVLGIHFGMEEDTFTVQGWSATQDFRQFCELAEAYLEDPAYREDARSDALKYFRQLEEGKLKSPGGVYASEIPYRLSGKHFVFQPSEYSEIERWTGQEVAQRFKDILQNAHMEISIVGDASVEEIIRHVGETFGQMPVREDFLKSLEKKKILEIPKTERTNLYYHAEGSEYPTAELHLFWPGLAEDNIELYRRQHLLARILSERLIERIRHDMGEAYSPYAHYIQSDAFPSYQWIHINISVDPAKIKSVESVFLEEVERLCEKGITEDEFQRVIEPKKNTVRDLRRKNAYWLNVLSHSQTNGRSLQYARTVEDFFQNVTREDLEWIARKILKKEQLYCYSILPDILQKKRSLSQNISKHRRHR